MELLIKIIIIAVVILSPFLSKNFRRFFIKTLKITKNKSDLAGINLINIIFTFILFAEIAFSAWLFYGLELSFLPSLLIFLVVFVLSVLTVTSITQKKTLNELSGLLSRGGEKIINHLWIELEVNKPPAKTMSFSETNLYYIEGIFALTDQKNIYLQPIVSYTKRPIIKIPINDISSIETENLKIARDRENRINKTWDALGVWDVYNLKNGIVEPVPVDEINSHLDKSLPLDRTRAKIKTSKKEYTITIHRKNIKSFKEIFQKLIS